MHKRFFIVIFSLLLAFLYVNAAKAASNLNSLDINKNPSLEEHYGYKKNNITPPTLSAPEVKTNSTSHTSKKISSKKIKSNTKPSYKKAAKTKKHTKTVSSKPKKKSNYKKPNVSKKKKYNKTKKTNTTIVSTVAVTTAIATPNHDTVNNNSSSPSFKKAKKLNASTTSNISSTTVPTAIINNSKVSNVGNIAPKNTASIASPESTNITLPKNNNAVNSNKTITGPLPGYMHYSNEDVDTSPSYVKDPDNVSNINLSTKQNNDLDKDYEEDFLSHLPKQEVKTGIIKKSRAKPDLNYLLISKNIQKSNDLYMDALSINVISKVIKEEITKRNFTPQVNKVYNIITEFPEATFYSDTMAVMNSAILFSSALEAIKDPKKGVSYKYAYVDNFLTSKYFENFSIVPSTNNIVSNTGYTGKFYNITNNKTKTTTVIFIEQNQSPALSALPPEFLLKYVHKSSIPYYTSEKKVIYVPHFVLIKPLNINYTLAPKDVFVMTTMCKMYFNDSKTKDLIEQENKEKHKNSKVAEITNSQNTQEQKDISLELTGICSNLGTEQLTDNILNNSLKLNKEEMIEYLNFIILRNNKTSEMLVHERNFLAQYYPDLYEKYKNDYNYSIEKIMAANQIINSTTTINLKRP